MNYYKLIWKNNFILAIFYTMVFFIVTYSSSVMIAKKDYDKRAESNVKIFSDNMSVSIRHAQDVSIILHDNEAVKNYIARDTPIAEDKLILSKYLSSTISAMPNANGTVGITNMASNHIVSKYSTMNFDFFCQSIGLSIDSAKGIAARLEKNKSENVAAIISSKKDENYLTIIHYDDTSFDRAYYIYFTFILDTMIGENKASGIYVLTMNDSIVYSSGNQDTDIAKLLYGSENLHYKRVNSIVEETDAYGKFMCWYLIPRSIYFYNINRFITWVVLLAFFIFFISFLIIQYMVRKIYAPVNSVMDVIKDLNMMQGENEFEAIRRTIMTYHQKTKNLIHILDNYKIPMREKFFKDTVQGLISTEKIKQGISEYSVKSDSSEEFVVIIFKYTNFLEVTENITDNGIYLLKQSLREIFKNAFSTYNFYEYFERDQSSHFIIVSVKNEDKLKRNIVEAVSAVENELDISIFAVVGFSEKKFEEIQNSYKSAERVMHKNYSESRSMIVFAHAYENKHADMIDFDSDTDKELLKYTLKCDREKVYECISEITSTNFFNGSITKEKHTQLIMMFSVSIFRILSAIGKTIEEIFGEGTVMYLELHDEKTEREFYAKVCSIFNLIIDNIGKHIKTVAENESNKMLEYIHNNYTKDISLIDLAEYLKRSTSYVSKEFKKCFGENFKDYLARYRIEAAKELLEEKNLNIADIAIAVGYNSANVFNRAFRKYLGITPSQYKETR